MKKSLCVLCSVLTMLSGIAACSPQNRGGSNEISTPVEKIDTLAQKLHQLDSTLNCGQLLHMDIYKLDKLKSVEFSIQAVHCGDTTIEYLNLRKDCGNDYYYSWEDARLLKEECKYLLEAINTIRENLSRETDHEERYAYITKDDIRIFASNDGGKNWKVALDVDYRKERSEISLSETDLDKLSSLISAAEARL